MKQENRKQWLLEAVSGLLLTGSGLSMAIDAGLNKLQGNEWFWYGTFALVLFQAGLCLIIDSNNYARKNP
jgi:hypothetical protein